MPLFPHLYNGIVVRIKWEREHERERVCVYDAWHIVTALKISVILNKGHIDLFM